MLFLVSIQGRGILGRVLMCSMHCLQSLFLVIGYHAKAWDDVGLKGSVVSHHTFDQSLSSQSGRGLGASFLVLNEVQN
jgi:hypothetical protein